MPEKVPRRRPYIDWSNESLAIAFHYWNLRKSLRFPVMLNTQAAYFDVLTPLLPPSAVFLLLSLNRATLPKYYRLLCRWSQVRSLNLLRLYGRKADRLLLWFFSCHLISGINRSELEWEKSGGGINHYGCLRKQWPQLHNIITWTAAFYCQMKRQLSLSGANTSWYWAGQLLHVYPTPSASNCTV